MKDEIIATAKKQASDQADSLIAQAQASIAIEKKNAIREIKSEVAEIAIDIATKNSTKGIVLAEGTHSLYKYIVKKIVSL